MGIKGLQLRVDHNLPGLLVREKAENTDHAMQNKLFQKVHKRVAYTLKLDCKHDPIKEAHFPI